MKRKRSQDDEGGGGANWMDTYGDLVTLLLCFFVLLFSFSSIDAGKWQQLVATFSGSSGVMEGFEPDDESIPSGITDPVVAPPTTTRPAEETTEPNPSPTPEPSPTAAPTPEPTPVPTPIPTPVPTTAKPTPAPTPIPEYITKMTALSSQIEQVVANSGLGAAVSIEKGESSVRIRLIASFIFEPGTKTLIPGAEALLQNVAGTIAPFAPIVTSMHTEGHTAGGAIDPASNINSDIELASARAGIVLDKIIAYGSGVSSSIIHTRGYPSSQYNPNLPPEQNDRVDVLLSSRPQ